MRTKSTVSTQPTTLARFAPTALAILVGSWALAWPASAQQAPEGSDLPRAQFSLAEGVERAFAPTPEGLVSSPGDEHPPEPRSGVEIEWLHGDTAEYYGELVDPAIGLRVVNIERGTQLLRVRAVGDAGTMGSRTVGIPVQSRVRPGRARELTLRLSGVDLDRLTHSGVVAVTVEACPAAGGTCRVATSAPLYFHRRSGFLAVYGEEVLCRQFSCGALDSPERPEPGTLRVMGGAPLGAVASDEELDAEAPATSAATSLTTVTASTTQALQPPSLIQICVKVDIQTTDSGLTANGITEDKAVGANDPVSYVMTGHGFRVRVQWANSDKTYDTDPESGCIVFQSPGSPGVALLGASVRVYGLATDAAGNRIRIHDAGQNTGSWYPGSTYSALWTQQVLVPLHTHTYIVDGRTNDRWTTMATAAYGLRRYHDGNAGKTVSIGFFCQGSTSIWSNSPNYIESNDAHLIIIRRCATGSSHTRLKAVVTHELGHAMLRLYYGYDGADKPLSSGYNPPASVTTPSPPQGPGCRTTSPTSYTMNSLEWNSLAFKEAFADFYSAKVWNNKASRGTYTWFNFAFDLEKWNNVGDTNEPGGFTLNWCGFVGSGVSTKGDYLRFLWDFYTLGGCASQPNRLDMFKIYKMVRENNRTLTFVLSSSNYDAALEYAIENSVDTLSACEKTGYDAYAAHNGI